MRSLSAIGVAGEHGVVNLSANFPCFATGKVGRGTLGMWGSNQAVDTIVTRKSPEEDGSPTEDRLAQTDADGIRAITKMGLQVAVKKKHTECWSLPGKFITSLGKDKRPLLSTVTHDRAKLEKECVREVFERELLPDFHGRDGPTPLMDDTITEELNTLFRKSAQSLVYRGYTEDPRNTDSAWCETSVFHVHYAGAPKIDHALEREREQNRHVWLEVYRVGDDALEFRDAEGAPQKLFGGHHEFVEMAVLTSFLGSPDFPIVYEGEKLGPPESDDEICCLDSNHSHYICVDDGGKTGGAAFGSEVAIRADLETFVSFYDYGARAEFGGNIDQITEYFIACVDDSEVHVGLGRIVALHYHSSILYHIP
jgi:hypothetical protein